ncbi:hypothetical protein NXS98_10995 [Fontisphaera persica]|uniref:hypothetical protein n=1 Tax=Fontisphaera persica TaxID=2974023 RepID=UPI0024BFE027|nr:hypothetical protein [Fontisphaera persica]WCJ58252.1 hypothetical protein NXS98_10995 [Fontisphaera persica]
MIRCAGSSSKGEGEGGSFGIGKNAPFAASLLRTVLYTTFNTDEEHVFQGVATLASHRHPAGGTLQPTGFLGEPNGASVRSFENIPAIFRRLRHGTDVIVLGFPDSYNWHNDLLYSVLDNFWPAIYYGDLEVKVGDMQVSKNNLQNLLETFIPMEGFTAHQFYKAFTNPTHEYSECLTCLKEVSLRIIAGDPELPKRIAMVRKTGMKIFEKHFRSIVPFCGVFMCRNDIGNKLLREMEPPRHDAWDPDHPEKGANRRIESEYVNFIRECIRKLSQPDDAKVISVPDLSRFLPDDDETPEESFDLNLSGTSSTPSAPEVIKGRKIERDKMSMQEDHMSPSDGDQETQEWSYGSMENSPKGNSTSDDRSEGAGSRSGSNNAADSSASHGGENSKPAIKIRYRTFVRDSTSGEYRVTVTPLEQPSKEVELSISAVGDDQKLLPK